MALFCWHKKQNEMAWWEGRWLTLKLIPVRTCYASQCQEGLPIGWVSKSLCVPANRSFMYIRLIYTPCIGVGVHWCVCVWGYLLRSDGGGCMLKPDIINAFYLQVLARRINTNANILRSPVPSLCWWLSWTWRVRNACVINALCCPLLMDVIEPRWLDIHTCLWTGQYYSIIRDWKVTYFVAFCCSACRKGMFIRKPVVGVRLRKDHFVFFRELPHGVTLHQAIAGNCSTAGYLFPWLNSLWLIAGPHESCSRELRRIRMQIIQCSLHHPPFLFV